MDENEMSLKTKVANDLFRQKWFRKLSPKYKALWLLLTVESNLIGVFEIDSASWSFFIGEQVSDEDVFTRFGNRFQRIPNHPDKGIIVGKLDFQCLFGKNSAQWKWVEKELAAVGLNYERLQEMKSREEEQMEFDLQVSEEKSEKAKAKERRTTIPPSVEWVREYVAENGYGVDAQKFCDYYQSQGWRVGKNKMKDWQAAVRNWNKNNYGGTVEKMPSAVTQDLRRKF